MMAKKKRMVPEIRFRGFAEEWADSNVSDFVATLDAGVSVNSKDRPANNSEFGVLKTSAVTNGVFEPDENKVVLAENEQLRLKEHVSSDTIIISRMNTPALVGANAYIESSHDNLFLPDRLWAAKPRGSASMRFLAIILGSQKGRAALSSMAKGTSGSMKNITKLQILALPIRSPSPTEQTKIGRYFKELDGLIGLHQRKHDKLVTLKQAMLQKMFPQDGATTPEIRFQGFEEDWEEKEINELGQTLTGSTPSTQNKRYYSENGIPWVTPTDIKKNVTFKTSSHLSDEGKKVARVAPKNTILVTCIASIGKNTLLGTQGSFNQQINGLVPDEYNYDPYFLYSLSSLWSREMKRSAASGTMQIVNKTEFSSIRTQTPALPEQQKIGTYFRKLDTLISQHATQLTKLKQIKSACLEKMFV
ncbi:MAG: restriction endonuclease subunit S [Verrucomicrobiales bacterium]|nr:restriction endonuclease subunit S [Verrucomicrobiales bacterium]